MSAPNNTYDPVRVAVLAPAEVDRMTKEALAAIGDAKDFAELKAARLAHRGNKAPLTLAGAEIAALPPEARAEAGRRIGEARRLLDQALAARQEELEADRDRTVLLDEAADVTLPWDRRPAGGRHPVTTLADVLEVMEFPFADERRDGGKGPVAETFRQALQVLRLHAMTTCIYAEESMVGAMYPRLEYPERPKGRPWTSDKPRQLMLSVSQLTELEHWLKRPRAFRKATRERKYAVTKDVQWPW